MAFPTNPAPVQGQTHNEAGINYIYDGVRWLLPAGGGLTEQQVRILNGLVLFARAYGYLQPPSGVVINPQSFPVYFGVPVGYLINADSGVMEDAVTYEFDWQDGSPIEVVQVDTPLPPDPTTPPDGHMTVPVTHTFASSVVSPHTVKIRVTNNWGTSDWVDQPLNLLAVPAPTLQSFALAGGGTNIYIDSEATFNYAGHLSVEDAAHIDFDFGDGSPIVTRDWLLTQGINFTGTIAHTWPQGTTGNVTVKTRTRNASATSDWSDHTYSFVVKPDAGTYVITSSSTWNDGALPTNAQLADGDLTTLLALKPQDVDTVQEAIIEFPVKSMPNWLTMTRVATTNPTGKTYLEGFRFDLITIWYDIEGDGTWVRSSDWDAKLPDITQAVKTIGVHWTKGPVKKIKFTKRPEAPAAGYAVGFGDLFFADTDLSGDNTPEPPQS